MTRFAAGSVGPTADRPAGRRARPRRTLRVVLWLQLVCAVALAGLGAVYAVLASRSKGVNQWAELGIALGLAALVVGLVFALTSAVSLWALHSRPARGVVVVRVIEGALLVAILLFSWDRPIGMGLAMVPVTTLLVTLLD